MKIRRLMFLALSACIFFGACGCGKDNNSSDAKNEGVKIIEVTEKESAFNGGTHSFDVKNGSHDLVINGKSDYKIVKPADASPLLNTAALELKVFFKQATGIVLEEITDDGLSYSPNGRQIILGKSKLADEAGIEVPDKTLGPAGLYIETKDSNLFLTGATDRGTINAVYEFLRQHFGWECYGTEECVLRTGITDIKLLDMKITDVPDIDALSSSYGLTDNNAQLSNRLQYSLNAGYFRMLYGKYIWHNSFKYLPPSEYKSKYPDAYSDAGDQLCYTAHGNKEVFEWMTDTVAEVIESEMKICDESAITITGEDLVTWCECNTCRELQKKYGTDSVSAIRFCNSVSRKVKAWFETDEGRPYKRDLKIAFFAYHATQKPPVKYDVATDSYVPIDDTVKCDENVGCIYAPIRATYQKPLYDEYNKTYYEIMRMWKAVTNNFHVWIYGTNFHYYLVPTNTYNAMQWNYQFIADNGAVWLQDQGQYNQPNSTGFSALKIYLQSKLTWNCYRDFNQLIDDFFANYFGPANECVRAYFDEMRAHWSYLENEKNYIGDCYLEPLDPALWPRNLLERWIGYCNEATDALLPLKKTDPVKYEIYYNNVLLESIAPRFLLIDLWRNKFSETEAKEMMLAFRSDCEKLSITQYSERADIYSLWNTWGI